MKQSRVLVTGGAGFIGSHLIDRLLDAGHRVVGLDNLRNGKLENLASARKSENFTFVEGDILKNETWGPAFDRIDVVYHLACLGVRHSLHSPLENHRVNAEGTLHMLEASRQHTVKKFFYISTSEVYGDIQAFPIDESGLPKPKTIYGSSKLAGENYAYSYHKAFGLDATVLRIFNNYGPRAHYEGDAGEVIPRTIVSILYGKKPVVYGDGNATRDFLFVKDTALALTRLMDQPNLEGEVINIGKGEEVSMRALVEMILGLMDKKLGIEYVEGRPADVVRLWVNANKFKKITGFTPGTSLQEGLLKTIDYYRQLKEGKDLLSEMWVRNWEKIG